MKTKNGDVTNYNSDNPLVDFFSKAGSLYEKAGSYYNNQASALDLFKSVWSVDKEKSFKLMLWCRDIRGGAGNRSGSRSILKWIATIDSEWVIANLELIPKYGRWDDLSALTGTPAEEAAMSLWAKAISSKDGLACKWAPRENKAGKAVSVLLRRKLKVSPKQYRKHLVTNTDVVESVICNRRWDAVEYSKVPSVAIGRYNKSFFKHDESRYSEWRGKAEKGEVKVNAGAIFPHDCFRTFKSETNFYSFEHAGETKNSKLANAQFLQMPDFFESNMRVMPIVDVSGSMTVSVSGSVQAIDVSVGLSMYASDRLGKDNPFYRKMIPFSGYAKFFSWERDTFSEAIYNLAKEPIHYQNTNISAALDLILESAKFFSINEDQLPNVLLVVSDMQFDCSGTSQGSMEASMLRWDKAGYARPKVVYWNTAGYCGSPATVYDPNTALVSGFSPSILQAVFRGDDFSPMGIMEQAISKYEVVVPK